MQSKDIVVIGDGLAARTVLASIDKNYNVLQVADNKKFPPASLSAGALASSYGARRGLSDLGDLNVASFEKFCRFVKSLSLNYEVQKMSYFINEDGISEIEKQRFFSRWGEEKISNKNGYFLAEDQAFLIHPHEYLSSLKKQYEDSFDFRSGTAFEIKNNNVVLDRNEVVEAKFIIDCRGAYDNQKSHKVAFGSYYVISYEAGDNDILLNIKGTNILYHSQYKKIVIGATTQNDGSMSADLVTMQSWHNPTDNLLESLNLPNIDWSKAEIMSGLRSKAKKRMPRFEWNDSILSIFGLYKNGLMYSVSALEELSKKINLDSRLQQ
jgi:hypothetical protein